MGLRGLAYKICVSRRLICRTQRQQEIGSKKTPAQGRKEKGSGGVKAEVAVTQGRGRRCLGLFTVTTTTTTTSATRRKKAPEKSFVLPQLVVIG